jgi:hypothetical protein
VTAKILIILAAVSLGLSAGCSKLDIKPQEASRLQRGLPAKAPDIEEGYGITGDPILPENEYVNLPDTATPAEWLTFKVKQVGRHEYAIDPNSISQGGDGIVRYALLIRTTGGVDNVSFEGIRCITAEWKMYATGRDNGAWTRSPGPVWRPISEVGLNAVRFTLFKDYVCDRDGVPFRNAQVVVTRIRESKGGLLSKIRQ